MMLRKLLTGAGICAMAVSMAQAAPAPAAAPAGSSDLPTQAQWDAMPASARAYVEKARALAGTDPDLQFDFGIFCKASGGATNPDRATLGVPNSEPRLQPYPSPSPAQKLGGHRLFDNFYWFGNTGVGAWLVTSDDGYILFDTMNYGDEAKELIIDEMVKFGLDPTKIKYVVMGHDHIDHTGGGAWIQQQYNPTMIMGRDDWNLYYETYATLTDRDRQRLNNDLRQMRRGVDAVDGMKITVGDVTATIHQMTGHTPGSIGMIVPVKWQGREHPILLVTAGSDVSNRNAFVGGYEHIWNKGIEAGVESVMQVHPNTNMNSLARMKYVKDNWPVQRHPMLYGKERTERYLNIVRACTQARMDTLGW